MATKDRPILRHFLYLNEDLVRDFLGQLPGGLDRETQRHVERSGHRGVEGGAQLGPAGLKAGMGDDTKRESEIIVEHTPAGEFQRLYTALLASDAIQSLPGLDERIWSQLSRDDILEFDSIVSLPAIARLVDLTDKFAPVLEVATKMGTPTPVVTSPGGEALDWGVVTKMMALFKTQQPSIIAAVAGAPRFRFVCKLEPKWITGTVDEVQGEATVFGKLQRKISRGEKLPTIDLMRDMLQVRDFPNRAARRRKQAGKDPKQADQVPDDLEFQIGYPAAVLTPIAVFR